jgi:hypothetical protein
MRVQSTGLGKMTLETHFSHLIPEDDILGEKALALQMGIEATSPVHWKIKAHLEPKDVIAMLKILLNLKLLWRVVRMIVAGIFSGSGKKSKSVNSQSEEGAKQNG